MLPFNTLSGDDTMHRLTSGLVRSSLLVFAAAGLAACGSQPGARVAATGQSLAVAPAPEDEAISQNVRMQLAREVPLAEIDVHTAQGKVQLSGTVEDTEAARKAVKGALATEGVRGVVNDLDVSKEGGDRGTSLAATAF